MAGTVEQKLSELGITLHEPNPPVANYVGFVRTGNLLFVSGQLPTVNGELRHVGRVGDTLDLAQAQEAARLLEAFGTETRIFNPSGLPLPSRMAALDTQPIIADRDRLLPKILTKPS